jgi:hypothetical protein
LDLLHSLQHQHWKYPVTLDEAWFYFANQYEQIWLSEDDDPPTNARPMIRSPKTMLTVVCNPHGFHVVKVRPRGCKWTIQYSVDDIPPEICALHFAGDRRESVAHADNARPYVAQESISHEKITA